MINSWFRTSFRIVNQFTPMEKIMSVAKVTEIIASSKKSFEDAAQQGIKRASETLNGITSAWVKSQSVTVKNGQVDEYRVNLRITFILGTKAAKTTKKKK